MTVSSVAPPNHDAGLAKVTLSRNETESLCMKAARGGGFSWGLAEEAGFAAGWLAAHGIDGATPLLEMLEKRLNSGSICTAPHPTPGHWKGAVDGLLCPIVLGTALSDSALENDGLLCRQVDINPVTTPILLIPFFAQVARICDKSLEIIGSCGRLLLTASGTFDRSALTKWLDESATAVTVRVSSYEQRTKIEAETLPLISTTTVNRLEWLALRTTVPATEASRRGTGGTKDDND